MNGGSPPASAVGRGGAAGRIDGLSSAGLAVAGAGVLSALSSPGPVVSLMVVAASSVAPLVAAWSIMRRRPPSITAADRVTLARLALIGTLSGALVLTAVGAMPARTWTVLIVAAVAAMLDAVDGWVARRRGQSTAAGARLDGESDAAALLVFSGLLAMTLGWWVLVIGLMRYLFLVGSFIRPAWRQELPYSGFRRSVGASQAAAVVVGLGPVVPVEVAAVLAAMALTVLSVSFGRDILFLERTGCADASDGAEGAG